METPGEREASLTARESAARASSLLRHLPFAIIVSAILALVFAGGASAEGQETPAPLPGSSNNVVVTPSTVVLGVDHAVAVNGSGFSDCQGKFTLSLLIDDTWRRSEPGALMGSATAEIGPDGKLNAVLPVDSGFPGDWTGYVVMEGGCMGDQRRLFGPVALAVEASGAALEDTGTAVPDGSSRAAGFLIPAAFVDSAFVSPDKAGATAETEFDHLSASVGGTLCYTANVAAGGREKSGDVVVWVGLPGQPDACRTGAKVRLTAGKANSELLNELTPRPGVIQSLRPVYSPPGTGANPDDESVARTTASGGEQDEGSGRPWGAIGAVLAGVAAVTVGAAVAASRWRRGRRAD